MKVKTRRNKGNTPIHCIRCDNERWEKFDEKCREKGLYRSSVLYELIDLIINDKITLEKA